MTINKGWKKLEWDSSFFKKNIGIIKGKRINEEKLKTILRTCKIEKIDCLYFLCDFGHLESSRLAQKENFRFMDIRLTMEKSLGNQKPPVKKNKNITVRQFLSEDLSYLKKIARNTHRQSRFYFDPCFPDRQCGRMYEKWIENCCMNPGWKVFVSGLGKQPKGYITVTKVGPDTGNIGLLGVSAEERGKGLGRALLAHSLEWFLKNGVKSVSVVTQGRNLPAQQLYQKNGFFSQSAEVWFHKWF